MVLLMHDKGQESTSEGQVSTDDECTNNGWGSTSEGWGSMNNGWGRAGKWDKHVAQLVYFFHVFYLHFSQIIVHFFTHAPAVCHYGINSIPWYKIKKTVVLTYTCITCTCDGYGVTGDR